MKDHEIAHLVNELRGIATTYANAEQLRSRISECVNNALKNSAPLSPDHSCGGAGVVLPERKPEVDYLQDEYESGLAEGWNACLDKVKELNQ